MMWYAVYFFTSNLMQERYVKKTFKNTLQPRYNAPHYNAVFNITRPCHGSQIDYFTISLYNVTSLLHGSLITWSVSMDPKDSVIMRLTCIYPLNKNGNLQVKSDIFLIFDSNTPRLYSQW